MSKNGTRTWIGAACALAGASVIAASALSQPSGIGPRQVKRIQDVLEDKIEYTDEFFTEKCRWTSTGKNLFFNLNVGYQLYLAGEDDGELVELYITVLDETRDVTVEIDDVLTVITTRVIEERELKDGELYEISRNFYARCKRTNDVYYFGEEVCFYKDGVCVADDGSWLAGEKDAEPGIIMPGTYLLGARYFQEIAPEVAMDRAEHTEMDVDVKVPAGDFEDCVLVLEDSALEPDSDSEKVYAPGVGMVRDDALELVWYGFLPGSPTEAQE